MPSRGYYIREPLLISVRGAFFGGARMAACDAVRWRSMREISDYAGVMGTQYVIAGLQRGLRELR